MQLKSRTLGYAANDFQWLEKQDRLSYRQKSDEQVNITLLRREESGSTASNFSFYQISSPRTFYEIRLKVIENSYQLLKTLCEQIDINQYNPQFSNEEGNTQQIIYCSVYMYQEKLRSRVSVYVLAPMSLKSGLAFDKFIRSAKTDKQFEIIVPIYSKGIWFVLTWQNIKSVLVVEMEHADFDEQSEEVERIYTKFNPDRRIIRLLDNSKIEVSCPPQSIAVTFAVLVKCYKDSHMLPRVQTLGDIEEVNQDFIYWCLNQVLYASLKSPATVEEASQKIMLGMSTKKLSKTHSETRDSLRSRPSACQKIDISSLEEEESNNFCLLCITWPFKSDQQNKK